MHQAVLPENSLIVAYPLRNGEMALMPRRRDPRSCVRLDGEAKLAFASRADARRGCPKQQITYRCRHCGDWHRATKRVDVAYRETWPTLAWVTRRAA
jgi:hypothetical protein